MSANFDNISLYIPHVFANINRNRVADTFENLRIGNVKRVDIVSKRSSNGEHYNTVYIHFNYWYDNVASRNFQERVLDPNMEARIVYDEPWYWIVLENKSANKSIGRKPRVNVEALMNTECVTPVKQMTNQDFANLFKEPEKDKSSSMDEEQFQALSRSISSEICFAQENAAVITMDEMMDENRKLREQLGEYMEKAGRLEHEFNMLMDDKISASNELAWLKEQEWAKEQQVYKMYNNV